MVTPRRCRDGACIPLCPSHRPWPGSKPPPSVSKCKQRQPAARRWPGYQCATRSSWLPARKPSRDLRWPQLLQCACTAWEGGWGEVFGGARGEVWGKFFGGTSAGMWRPRQRQRTRHCQVSCSHLGWQSGGPTPAAWRFHVHGGGLERAEGMYVSMKM